MNVIRPNLFIIGAMKSGTTSLHTYLNGHPEIYMCKRKEPSYFVDKKELSSLWPELARMNLFPTENDYLAQFSDAGNAKYIGESSTAYSKAPRCSDVAEKIYKFNPTAKIIYLLRDPVERAISHYWHAVNSDGEHRDMISAFKKEPHYIEVSDYALQLSPYFANFKKDQILILTLEQMIRNKSSFIRALYSWLDVDPEFVPDSIDKIENATPKTMKKAAGLGLLYKLRQSKVYDKIENLIPKNIRELAFSRMTKNVTKNDKKREEAVLYLRQILQEKTNVLQSITGESYEEWTTLWGKTNENPLSKE